MNSDALHTAIDNLIGGVAVFTWDPGTRELVFDYLNDGLFRMLGTTRAAAERYIEHNVRDMVIPQDVAVVDQWLADVIADNGDVETIFRYVTFQGALAYMRVRGNLLNRTGTANQIICMLADCTDETNMQREIQKQLNFMNSVIDSSNRFDYNVRTDTCALFVNNGGSEDAEEIVIPNFMGGVDQSNIYADDRAIFTEAMKRAMKQPCKDQIEYRIRELDGTGDYRWHQCSLMSIAGNDGYVTHVMGLVVDINDRKLEEEKLLARADRDSLTALLNKGATEEIIRGEIEAHHLEQHMDALMMIDVDDFKYINDHFGHQVGDQVLHHVGEVLQQNLKGRDVAGRIGGDEFMVFLQNIKAAGDTEVIASHLQECIREGFADKEVAESLSVSIGIAVATDQNEEYEELYREADTALYETKHRGKAGYTVFREEEKQ
ncbi:MAG: diguanylate cyclase [Lachnospiraceae bacterium]|nr:diguanylate cyclase [Lachnospiraceae bacterium]